MTLFYVITYTITNADNFALGEWHLCGVETDLGNALKVYLTSVNENVPSKDGKDRDQRDFNLMFREYAEIVIQRVGDGTLDPGRSFLIEATWNEKDDLTHRVNLIAYRKG
jgi:hypothetical protein